MSHGLKTRVFTKEIIGSLVCVFIIVLGEYLLNFMDKVYFSMINKSNLITKLKKIFQHE